jgi:hypothetical protein
MSDLVDAIIERLIPTVQAPQHVENLTWLLLSIPVAMVVHDQARALAPVIAGATALLAFYAPEIIHAHTAIVFIAALVATGARKNVVDYATRAVAFVMLASIVLLPRTTTTARREQVALLVTFIVSIVGALDALMRDTKLACIAKAAHLPFAVILYAGLPQLVDNEIVRIALPAALFARGITRASLPDLAVCAPLICIALDFQRLKSMPSSALTLIAIDPVVNAARRAYPELLATHAANRIVLTLYFCGLDYDSSAIDIALFVFARAVLVARLPSRLFMIATQLAVAGATLKSGSGSTSTTVALLLIMIYAVLHSADCQWNRFFVTHSMLVALALAHSQ